MLLFLSLSLSNLQLEKKGCHNSLSRSSILLLLLLCPSSLSGNSLCKNRCVYIVNIYISYIVLYIGAYIVCMYINIYYKVFSIVSVIIKYYKFIFSLSLSLSPYRGRKTDPTKAEKANLYL